MPLNIAWKPLWCLIRSVGIIFWGQLKMWLYKIRAIFLQCPSLYDNFPRRINEEKFTSWYNLAQMWYKWSLINRIIKHQITLKHNAVSLQWYWDDIVLRQYLCWRSSEVSSFWSWHYFGFILIMALPNQIMALPYDNHGTTCTLVKMIMALH